ncbi:MAG: type II toxin-antitoxin system HicA family toxin [Candidatus Dormibacteraeota bacterium]|nr:type II toxin-antitoxin system HicA family toxin [Candidatus Dormibacteraeota bacterium]
MVASVAKLRQLLHRKGYSEVRQSGSHLVVRCDGCQTVIPVHSGDLPSGTLRAIERDLEPCLVRRWLQTSAARRT